MPQPGTRKTRPASRRRTGAASVLLAFILGSGTVPAGAAEDRQGTIEFSYGRYNMADPLFKTVYQQGAAMGGLGLTARLVSFVDFYLDARYMRKEGQLSYSKEKTSLVLIPISLGLRGCWPVSFIEPFIGLGLDTYIFYETNPIGTTVDHAAGWHVGGGFYVRLGKSVPILPFARIKYAMVKSSIKDKTVDLGGLEFGAGLAVAF